jgi:phosphatidylinositol alpha-1,6-mannosyltransferase
MIRILALVTDAFGGQGGIARYNRDFLSALASSPSVASVVVLPRLEQRELEKLPPKLTWKSAPFGKLSYVLSAGRVLAEEGPFDLVYCGHIHFTLLAALLARAARISFWLQLYGVEAWKKPFILSSWAARRACRILTISRYTQRMFHQWAGVPQEKFRLIPCTIDEKFQPGRKPDYLLKRYRLTGKKVLLTVARLSSRDRYKGQDRVIRLMPRLLQRETNLVYVIAGEGDDRARLEALAHQQGLDGAVRFIGEIKELELVDHYRMADLFVMPSTGEGFGIVFLEAAACGIPVVGGNKDGSVDALCEGGIGSAVDPHDPDQLAQAIEEGLHSRTISPRAIQQFSRANFCRLVEDLLKEKVKGDERFDKQD